MQLSQTQINQLLRPLHRDRIKTRQGSGGAGRLSYLAAWDVRRMLISIFGFGGFSVDVVEQKVEHFDRVGRDAEGNGTGNWMVTAWCKVRLTIYDLQAEPDKRQDVTYTEVAASSQVNPQLGEAMDFALKTAESDALKRAAVNLGTQFGLSLYAGQTTDVVYFTMTGQRRVEEAADADAEDKINRAVPRGNVPVSEDADKDTGVEPDPAKEDGEPGDGA